MKLAFLTSLVPTIRPDTGYEIANVAIVDALRAAGHELTVIGFARPGDELRPDPGLALLGRLTIENHQASSARKALWAAAAIAQGMPVAAAKLRLAGEGLVIEAVKARGPFDALILNSVGMAGAFPAIAKLGPFLFVEHNIEHISAEANAAHAGSSLMRRLYAREARMLERLEMRLARDAAFVWCLAEEDRAALGPGVAAKSAVLPLVSSTGRAALPDGEPPRHDIGLIGTWTWEPNLIGLRWFLAEVAPRLPAHLTVAVAGRMPDSLAAPANVSFHGRVPDAAAFLADCAVVALASRAGTGVQLKTVEALQLGLPAVATTLSLRGFASLPANLRVADEPAAFAEALAAQVAGVRAGSIRRLDGDAFVAAQRLALSRAIEEGLSRVKRA